MASTPFLLGGTALPLDDQDVAEGAVAQLQAPLSFTFIHREIGFSGRLAEQPETRTAVLDLSGDLGALPFSAEGPRARAGVHAIINSADQVLGEVFRLDRNSRIRMVHHLVLPLPVTAVSLVAAIATVLIKADPYLECLATILRPPCQPGRPGESRVRPAWRRTRRLAHA